MNGLDGERRDGVLATGAGALPLPGPEGPARVAFRPEALTLSPDGPLTFAVAETVFEGTRQRLTLKSPAGTSRAEPLIAYASSAVMLLPGERQRFALNTAALLPDAATAA